MKIDEHEKRWASYHEAGHAVLFRRFGGIGSPRIWRNKTGSDDQCAWLGAFTMFVEPGRAVIGSVLPLLAPKNWRVLVGLAGLAAERIADEVDETDVDELTEFVFSSIDAGEASPSDLEMMGDDWLRLLMTICRTLPGSRRTFIRR